MASQQRDPKVHHQDREQQPSSSIQRAQQELQELMHGQQQLGVQGAKHTGPIAFTDLPQPWFQALVKKLEHQCRIALFRTCIGNAAAVVQHSSKLTLTPQDMPPQDRRKFVLSLAAGSSNISLHLTTFPILLDVPAIWPCIKHLKLCNVNLNIFNMLILHLPLLTQLHTISLEELVYLPSIAWEVPAVQQMLQAGLPALRTVDCAGVFPVNARRLAKQLGPVLGHRVTQLAVHEGTPVEVIDKWPALQRLEVQMESSGKIGDANDTAVKRMIHHPQLQEAVVPASIFGSARSVSGKKKRLPVLELTDYGGPILFSLLRVPVQAVDRLRFQTGTNVSPGVRGVSASKATTSLAAAQHLRQCSHVEVLPRTWSTFREYKGFSSIAGDMLTWEAPFDPDWLGWLLPVLNQAEGALILSNDPYSLKRALLGVGHADSLHLLPTGIHTLAFDYCKLDGGLTWARLVAHVPQHVRVLIFRNCTMKLEQFEAVLEQRAPPGLQTLGLVVDGSYHMPWVATHVEVVKARVEADWPGVRLELIVAAHFVAPDEDEDDSSSDYGYDEDEDYDTDDVLW